MKHKLPWLNKSPRIAIIGDIILDEYLDGNVSRISPEAPVPIHHVKASSHSPGGAANAARNISLSGGEAHLFGSCGIDESSKILFELLQKDKVHTDHIISLKNRPTHRKTRISSSNQQILRIDWERIEPLEASNQDILFKSLSKERWDAILISDYGKGLLPKELLKKIFEFSNQYKIPSIVDPKGKDFSRYRGCTIMTPNLKECYQALNLDENSMLSGKSLGERLQKTFGLQDILVTMGAEGMVYVPYEKEKNAVYEKTRAKEVYDVSGAGDTVAALLTLGLASKEKTEDILAITNLGAAIVVGKWGTQAVSIEELGEALQLEKENSTKKLSKIFEEKEREQLKNILKEKEGQKIVFTNGCFDILHAGHVDYLKKSKELGDLLVVGVNTDESIKKLKGPERPINELKHRLQILEALECIDYIIPFSENTPLELIQTLSPQVLVKGADYREEDIVGGKSVQSKGGEIKTIELVPGLSSSHLIQKIKNLEKLPAE